MHRSVDGTAGAGTGSVRGIGIIGTVWIGERDPLDNAAIDTGTMITQPSVKGADKLEAVGVDGNPLDKVVKGFADRREIIVRRND